MTDMDEFLRESRRQSNEAREQFLSKFATQSTFVFVFTGAVLYAAFATFGVEWARLAGMSGWQTAAWPVAVATTTAQALYCRVRLWRGWYPDWVSRLFDAVGWAGLGLAAAGSGWYAAGYPHEFTTATAALVKLTPYFCLLISITMTRLFLRTLHIPARPARSSDLGRPESSE